jgi:hypothetical protein
MKIPFTVEQFLEVFARYNEAVWPMQVILIILSIAIIMVLFRTRPYSSRLIAAILSFFCAWMAIAYHFAFFTAINPAAWLFGVFFLVGALWLAWLGVFRNKLQFSLHRGLRAWVAGSLIVFSLIIYPLLGFLSGHHYPAMPTFGLPCPTTIFTLGILMFAASPFPRSAFIVPLLWSAVGSLAAFQLRVPQDYGLFIAGLIGFMAAIFPLGAYPKTSSNRQNRCPKAL